MADYWMKLYIEILDDPKMATLPDRVWRRIVELFLVAKRQGKDGHIPDTRQIAWMLRLNSDELESDMAQIAQTGIVVRELNGWYIPKFMSRQEASPAKVRMAEMRERNQRRQYYDDVTDELRDVTQINRLTENREQKQKQRTDKKPAAPDVVFPSSLDCSGFRQAWGEWVTFRAEIKHKLTPTTIKKQFAQLEQFNSTTAIAMINQSIEKGWQGLFPVNGNGNGHHAEPPIREIPADELARRKAEFAAMKGIGEA